MSLQRQARRFSKVAGPLLAVCLGAGSAPASSQQKLHVGFPSAQMSPRSLDFGSQSVATSSAPLLITVSTHSVVPSSSIGTVGIELQGADFTQTNDCQQVRVGDSCTIVVRFAPAPFAAPPGASSQRSGSITAHYGSCGSLVIGPCATVQLFGTAEQSLVSHYYRALLRRSPDPGGRDFWNGEAARLHALGVNPDEVGFAMAAAFLASAEYAAYLRDDAGFVTDLYNAFLARAPDDAGLAYWSGQLAGGMPRGVVATSFMFSPEFGAFARRVFGSASGGAADIDAVTDFYRGLLGRLPDGRGLSHWVYQFRLAQCQGAAVVRAQADAISSSFAESPEYAARGRTNADYVADLYNAFLRRGGDLEGIRYWIAQLDSGALTRNQVRQAFVASPEFGGRVAAIVAQGCQL